MDGGERSASDGIEAMKPCERCGSPSDEGPGRACRLCVPCRIQETDRVRRERARKYVPPTAEEFARSCLRVSMEATADRAWVTERHGDETSALHEIKAAPGETDADWRVRIEDCVLDALASVFGEKPPGEIL